MYLDLSAHERYFSLRTSFMCLQLFFSCLFHQQFPHSAICAVASAFDRNESPPQVTSPPRSGSWRSFLKTWFMKIFQARFKEVKIFHWEMRHREASHFLCYPSRSFSRFFAKWKTSSEVTSEGLWGQHVKYVRRLISNYSDAQKWVTCPS